MSPKFLGTMDEWMRDQERRVTSVERRKRRPGSAGETGPVWTPITIAPGWTASTFGTPRTSLWAGMGWIAGNRLYPTAPLTLTMGVDVALGTIGAAAHYPLGNQLYPALLSQGTTPTFCVVFITTAGAIMLRPASAGTLSTTGYVLFPNSFYATP